MKDYRDKEGRDRTQETGGGQTESRDARKHNWYFAFVKTETQSFWPKREVPLFLTRPKCDFFRDLILMHLYF